MDSTTKKVLIGTGIIAVAVAVTIAILNPSEEKDTAPLSQDQNCITIYRSELKNILGDDLNEPRDPDYRTGIIFMPMPGGDINIPVFGVKDCEPDLSKAEHMNIATWTECAYNGGAPIICRYDLQPEDIKGSGSLIDFDFVRLTQATDPEGNSVFQVDFVTNVNGVERTFPRGFAKPCPPYCHT